MNSETVKNKRCARLPAFRSFVGLVLVIWLGLVSYSLFLDGVSTQVEAKVQRLQHKATIDALLSGWT